MNHDENQISSQLKGLSKEFEEIKQQQFNDMLYNQLHNLQVQGYTYIKIDHKDTINGEKKAEGDRLYQVKLKNKRQCLKATTIISILLNRHPSIKLHQIELQTIQVDITSQICKQLKNYFIILNEKEFRAIQLPNHIAQLQMEVAIMKKISSKFIYGPINLYKEIMAKNLQEINISLFSPFSLGRITNPVLNYNCILHHLHCLFFVDYSEIKRSQKYRNQLKCPYPKCESNYLQSQNLIYEEQFRKRITEEIYKDQFFLNYSHPYFKKNYSQRNQLINQLSQSQFKDYSNIIRNNCKKQAILHHQIVLDYNIKIPSRCKNCSTKNYEELSKLIIQIQLSQQCSLCHNKIKNIDKDIYVDVILALILHLKLTKEYLLDNSYFTIALPN